MGGKLVLGVETSGPRCSVALLNGLDMIAEQVVPLEGSRRASALIEVADALFSTASLSPQQLGLVAVSIGPGSFTGLRIGVTFAKTLAYAVGCPVVGVNSLHAVAESADSVQSHLTLLHIVSDAQRGEVFHQAFQGTNDESEGSDWMPTWKLAGPREIVRPTALAASVGERATLAGPAIERHREDLMRTGQDLQLIQCEPTAVSVARLGASLTSEQCVSWSLLPDYGRPSSAEEKREQARA